jgi:T5orf172 domain
MTEKPILKKGYLYVLKDWNLTDTYKIGITTRAIQKRIKELNQSPGSAVKLEYLSTVSDRYKIVEKKLHKIFENQNTYSGQNLSLSEWFVLSEVNYQLLKALLKYEFEC